MLKIGPKYFDGKAFEEKFVKSLTPEQVRLLEEVSEPGQSCRLDTFAYKFNEAGWSGRNREEKARLREAFGLDDFGLLMAGELNRFVQRGYDQFPQDWRRVVRTRTLRDYKTVYPIFVGSFGPFEPTAPGEPSPADIFTVHDQMSYTPRKYTKEFVITLEAATTDDLGVLRDNAARFGAAAALTLNRFVFRELLDANPSYIYPGDTASTPLIDPAHNNYLGNAKPLTIDNIKDAIGLMLSQRDLDGNPIQLRPRYLIVHPKYEVEARTLVQSERLVVAGSTDTKVPEVNPIAGMLEVISTPHIQTNNGAAWYLVADPQMANTFEVGFVDGIQRPVILTEPENVGESFSRLIRRFKAVLAFGGLPLDPRAVVGANFA